MFRFIFNFILFGILFYLIWYFFPDAFNKLVGWAADIVDTISQWFQALTTKVKETQS